MQSWIWIWYALITSCSDYHTDVVWNPPLLRAVIGLTKGSCSLDPAKLGRRKERQKVNKAQQKQPENSHHRLLKRGEPQYEWKMKKYSHAGIEMQINPSWSCTQTWTWHHTQVFINNKNTHLTPNRNLPLSLEQTHTNSPPPQKKDKDKDRDRTGQDIFTNTIKMMRQPCWFPFPTVWYLKIQQNVPELFI